MREPILIANGSGFWGDSILAPRRLVNEGPLHYLTLDFLAEVTMSIMQKLRSRDPNAGYATDFITILDRILPQMVDQGIKVVSSAGGVNPEACRRAVAGVIRKHDLTGLKVGIVSGDDILGRLAELRAAGAELSNLDSGEPFHNIEDRMTSANAYLGAFPIAEALALGADIVICGRVTDPSLVLGPLIHEFGWSAVDFSRLAAGTIAGHILECGAQCTGANYSNWREVSDFTAIGYPVVEAYSDGRFVVTKHEDTGGLVNTETVASQLLYEMGDPRAYITPDVVADFTSARLHQEGPDRVRVDHVQGSSPTDFFKASISYRNGYKAVGQLTIAGPDALDKARLCAEIIFGRLKMDGVEFADEDRVVEFLGSGECLRGIVPVPPDLSEIVLRLGVRDPDRSKVERFGMEIVPLVTSGPPGVTGFAGGRPKPTEIISYWPALVRKEFVAPHVDVQEID